MQNYLALDPGKQTGWAFFSNGAPLDSGIAHYGGDLFSFLEASSLRDDVDGFVVEDYKIRTEKEDGYSHRWDTPVAVLVIGIVEYLGWKYNKRVVRQPSTIKKDTAKVSGIANNGNHKRDAILHGLYYWWKENPLAKAQYNPGRKDTPTSRSRPPTRVVPIDSYAGLRRAGSKASVEVPEQGV